MTEPWFRDAISAATDAAPPTSLSPADVLTSGRAARRRRSARRGTGAVAVAAVLGVAAAGVASLGGGPQHASRIAAAPAGESASAADSPSPVDSPSVDASAAPVADDGRTAPYWHDQLVGSIVEVKNGVATNTSTGTVDFFVGHDRPSVNFSDGKDPSNSPAWNGNDGTAIGWDEMWTLPTDPDGLRAWYAAHAVKPQEANAVYGWAESLLDGPGPVALHRGFVQLLDSQPGVVITTGTDDRGRAAHIITHVYAGSRSRVLTDPTTGTELQTDDASDKPQGGNPGDPAQPATQGDTNIYTIVEPSDTAPTVAPKAAPTTRPPAADGSCTPGTIADPTSAADRLAAICLADPAPGFAYRRSPDGGGRDGTSFYLASSPEKDSPVLDGTGKPTGVTMGSDNGASVTLQILKGDAFILAGVHTPTPDAKGKVGNHETAVGTTAALGVTATEVVVTGPGSDHQIGLLLSKDGLAIEVYGNPGSDGTPVSYDQLVTLLGALRGV